MKLIDLSDNQRRILTLLNEAKDGGMKQSQIRKRLGLAINKPMPEGTVSSSLARLEAYGLVEKPEQIGKEWMITAAGVQLFHPPVPSSAKPEPVPAEPVPEQLPPPPEAKPEPPVPALSTRKKKALRKRERLKETINQVFGQLTPDKNPSIPDDARFVYREIISGLPESLRKILTPITVWVGEPKQ